MNDLDAIVEDDTARDFAGLDARGAQTALAAELSETMNETENQEDQDHDDGQAEAEAETSPVVEWSDEDIAEHARMAEALLFAAAEPLDERTIADRLPAGADIAAILEKLSSEYEGRGVGLSKVDKKWRFMTASDVAFVLEKERVAPRKLSRAALETLAVIAYHQPCTRADIEDVRGVAVSKGSLDQLLEIGWVKMRGKRRDVPGRPTLYGTSEDFLQHFGLETVTDLPGLSDLKAAGLLDARLPPGFSVPTPVDGDDVDEAEEDGEADEFVQDFHDAEDAESADG
ncbi:MAG: SMC-Scp complex subunit ScpB [Pseudomonadota bacterium]